MFFCSGFCLFFGGGGSLVDDEANNNRGTAAGCGVRGVPVCPDAFSARVVLPDHQYFLVLFPFLRWCTSLSCIFLDTERKLGVSSGTNNMLFVTPFTLLVASLEPIAAAERVRCCFPCDAFKRLYCIWSCDMSISYKTNFRLGKICGV